MRQETNNEMDLLLRRLSRRGDEGVRNGGTGPGDRHLDVDELSSYAQNALPAAARARYTEHLAECAPCRKLVTELALSLGAAAAPAPAKTGLASGGLKAFLANLFSPMVLRYAVPALAVIVVMVIGFVAFRQQRKTEFVAQVAEQKRTVPEQLDGGLIAPTPAAPLEGFTDHQQRQAESAQGRVDQRTSPKHDGNVNTGAAPVTKSTDEIAAVETRPAAAAAEPPAPAATKLAAAEERQETSKEKKAETEAKKQPASTVGTADNAKVEANKAANEPTARSVSALPAQNRDYRGLQTLRPAARARDEKDATDKEATETRSVAGRTFKKERGIWIDTAYDSSTRTRNVARGSESFRALVADEPAINTIAEQLDGEVIVVWKGRAYRIN